MRAAFVLSSIVLSSSVVAGCGSSGADTTSSSAYCKDLRAAKSDMAFLSTDKP